VQGRRPAFANGSTGETRARPESPSLIDVSHCRAHRTHTSQQRAMLGHGEVAEEEEEVSATPPQGSRQATWPKTCASATREATRIVDPRIGVRDQRRLNVDRGAAPAVGGVESCTSHVPTQNSSGDVIAAG
jgi:hypothetical protein